MLNALSIMIGINIQIKSWQVCVFSIKEKLKRTTRETWKIDNIVTKALCSPFRSPRAVYTCYTYICPWFTSIQLSRVWLWIIFKNKGLASVEKKYVHLMSIAHNLILKQSTFYLGDSFPLLESGDNADSLFTWIEERVAVLDGSFFEVCNPRQ